MSVYSTLKINGLAVARPNPMRVRPLSVSEDVDSGDWEADLVQGPGTYPVPALDLGDSIEITRNAGGEVLFRGKITSASPSEGGNGWTWTYHCVGLSGDLNRIAIMNPALAAGYVFNRRTDDPEYSPATAGLTVGGMVVRVLTDHSAALAAAGVTFDPADFDALDSTPYEPVTVSGENLWNVLRELATRHSPVHRLRLLYGPGTCKLTVRDLNAPAEVVSVAMGTSTVPRFGVQMSLDQVYTAHRVVGDGGVGPFEFRRAATLDHEKIEDTWTPTQASSWKLDDYLKSQEAASEGSVVSMTATTVTIDPADNTQSWSVNDWAGAAKGRLYLSGTLISFPGMEVTSQEARMVASNTDLTAGGTSTVTVDVPFTQDTFTKYKLFKDPGVGSKASVYRTYRIKDATLRTRLRSLFPRGERYADHSQSGTQVLTWAPMCFIVAHGIRWQIPASVDPSEGTITFAYPVVMHPALENSEADLQTPGSTKNLPEDVVAFVPIASDELSVRSPETGFAGTAYDWFGIESEHVTFLSDWNDVEAKAQVQKLCDQRHEVERDVRMDASLVILGLSAHEWLNRDRAVNLTATMGDGGTPVNIGRWSQAPLAVRRISIAWGAESGMTTSLALSTAKQPMADEGAFLLGSNNSQITNNFMASSSLPSEGGVALIGDAVAGTNVMDSMAINSRMQDLAAGGVTQQQGLAAGGVATQQGIAAGGVATQQGLSNQSVVAQQQMGGAPSSPIYAGAGYDPGGNQSVDEYMQSQDESNMLRGEEDNQFLAEADRRRKEGDEAGAKEMEDFVAGRYEKKGKY